MRAVKGNKEYTIDDTQHKFYQDSGFDILDEYGEVIAYGRGKTVPFDEHMRLVAENARLHDRIAELEAGAEGDAAGAEEDTAGAKTEEEPDMLPETEPEKKKAGTKKAGE